MKNDALYQALRTLFNQEPEVANLGADGVFSCPPPIPMLKSRLGRGEKRDKVVRFAKVEDWGECYRVNCPRCGDTRNRLYFSHLYGMTVKSDKKTYQFGKIYHCFHEGCCVHRELDHLEYDEAMHVVDTKPRAYINIVQEERRLPQGCLPLISPYVPQHVLEMLDRRRFTREDLYHNYFVHYAPKGTLLENRSEDYPDGRPMYEDRLIIPCIQGRKLIGFQARIISGESKCKYLTTGFKTARSLYNRDAAMFHRDITIVEGVTDVWRAGPSAVALFGKTLKAGQLELMKMLWGFNGSCVVCIDRDEKAGVEGCQQAQAKIIDLLRAERVFPRGVAGAELPVGRDPADMTTSELTEIVGKAREQCK